MMLVVGFVLQRTGSLVRQQFCPHLISAGLDIVARRLKAYSSRDDGNASSCSIRAWTMTQSLASETSWRGEDQGCPSRKSYLRVAMMQSEKNWCGQAAIVRIVSITVDRRSRNRRGPSGR